MRNIALVLSGGGSKGAFQAGAVKCLLDKGLRFSVVAGTSVGALNGLIVSQEKPEDIGAELENWWFNVRNKDVYKPHNFIKRLRRTFRSLFSFKDSLPDIILPESAYDNSPLRELINCYIELPRVKSNVEHFLVYFISLQTGKLYCKDITTVMTKEDAVNYILTSTIIPMAFPPFARYVYDKEIEELLGDKNHLKSQQYVDGGVMNKTPLKIVFEYDVGTVYVINNFPRYPNVNKKSLSKKFKNLFSVGLRSILDLGPNGYFERDIKDAEDVNNDIQVMGQLEENVFSKIKDKNLKVEIENIFEQQKQRFTFLYTKKNQREKKEIQIVGIYPENEIEIFDTEFDPEKSKELFELGYQTAEKTVI
jgi:NTE family protein